MKYNLPERGDPWHVRMTQARVMRRNTLAAAISAHTGH